MNSKSRTLPWRPLRASRATVSTRSSRPSKPVIAFIPGASPDRPDTSVTVPTAPRRCGPPAGAGRRSAGPAAGPPPLRCFASGRLNRFPTAFSPPDTRRRSRAVRWPSRCAPASRDRRGGRHRGVFAGCRRVGWDRSRWGRYSQRSRRSERPVRGW